MTKLFLFLVWMLMLLSAEGQYTSIHHQQSDQYNSENKTTEWYEQNVNTDVYYFSNPKSNCNLNKVVYGWHPYWVGSAYNNYDWDLLSHFSFFSYEVNETNGNPLSTHGWATSDAVDSALANGVKVTLCVTLFGGTDLTTFLTNSTAKQTLITNLIDLVQTRGAHGVNIDFEGLPASQKVNFANFMVDLSNQMHTAIPGSEVSTVLYAVDWNDVFDFAIMDPVVDHFIVMGYAYYYQGSGNTGPCDPLYHFGSSYNYTLSKTTTYYIDKGCSPSKLVMGLPYYGYEWPTTNLTIPSATTGTGVAKTFANVMNNSSGNYSAGNHSWDADSYTDIYAFNDGANKQCFIALEDGFRKRLEHINNSGIAGIGIWALGYDNGYNQLWNAIEDYFTNCKADPCSGIIHDFGGPTKNYYNNENYTWTLSPPGAFSIDIDFTSFDVELDYDTLFIYDGVSTADPLIGSYTGTNSPGSFTTSTGDVTFYFKSDGATVAPGWLADYSCNTIQSNFSSPSNPSICQGELLQFTNTSVNGTAYYWEFENGTPPTSTDTEPMITYNTSGTNDITLYAINGTDTVSSTQTITVSVTDQPLASFTSNSPVYYPNSSIFFTNTSTGSSTYSWSFGDGNSSGDTNPWNDYMTVGTYTVQLIAMNSICPNDTTIQVIEIIENVGLSENQTARFTIYPNPFKSELYIDGIQSEKTSVKLFNSNGKVIAIEFHQSIGAIIVPEGIPAGLYLLEISDEHGVEKIPIIKE
jgi:spore germination protein YaaH/PKD repeat protein